VARLAVDADFCRLSADEVLLQLAPAGFDASTFEVRGALLNGARLDEDPAGFRGVRQLVAGGDVLSPAPARRVLEACPGLLLVNGYGPTENTTFTCCHPVRAVAEVGETRLRRPGDPRQRGAGAGRGAASPPAPAGHAHPGCPAGGAYRGT